MFEDPTKYILSDDLTKWNDYYNFQNWNMVKSYYHENGHPEFERKVLPNMKETMQKLATVLKPFYKAIFEAKGRKYVEEKDITFGNFWGNDILVDDKYNCHLVEANITPSCGDYGESQGLGTPVNNVFNDWAHDAIQLW